MRAQYHGAPGAGASCPGLVSPRAAGTRGATEPALRRTERGARAARRVAGQVPPFEPEDSYCPVGQTCDVACAEGFAGFDAAKNCKNANVGYCCK